MKRSLMDAVSVMLLRHGYTVRSLTRTCFDVIGRRDSRILLIKVLEDANSITEEYASSMKNLSSFLGGAPVIVAEKGGHVLEDGVVYFRFGVCTCSAETLLGCLDNRFPVVASTRAGFTASVIGSTLRQSREEMGLSLGALSRKVGVSKRMIARYESDDADVSLRSAISLQRIFGSGIFIKIDIFSLVSETASRRPSLIAGKFGALGFRASDTRKAPFDVIAKLKKELILTEVSRKKSNPQLDSMRQLLGADALVIFEKSQACKLPSMEKRDFLGIDSAEELIKFLKEYE